MRNQIANNQVVVEVRFGINYYRIFIS